MGAPHASRLVRPGTPRADVVARLRALRERAERAVSALDLDLAGELFDAGHVLGNAVHEPADAAACRAGLGYVAQLRGENTEACAHYRAALPHLPDELRARVRMRHAFARYDQGCTQEARVELEALLGDGLAPAARARVLGFLGNVARAEGQWQEATALYAESRRELVAQGDHEYAVTFAMDTAIVAMLAHDPHKALAELATVRDHAELTTGRYLAALFHHYDAIAHAQLELPYTPPPSLDADLPVVRFLEQVRSRLTDPAPFDATELHTTSPENAHARMSLDLLEAHRARRGAVAESRCLLVAHHGGFFRLAEAPLVTLAQRAPLKRLVLSLATARLAWPGRFLEPAELAEAAWPGEHMLPASRKNRLHVALSTLRNLGLRPVLESNARGYRIDPHVRTVLVS